MILPRLIRHLLRLCVVMLFSALAANMAFAMPVSTSDITYFQSEPTHIGRGGNVGFAARAPPLAVSNVAITGGVTVMQGSAYALGGQKTVAALFGFGGDHDAPNRGFGSTDEAFDAISDFRSRTAITDAQGGTGTVAVTEINGQRYFGVNSTNLSDADRNLGRLWRDRLGLTRGQDQVVFHAEAHSLMRAYERTNGTMPSNLTLYVDRNSCGVCQTYLPRMADEMGITNLNLSFTSGRSGVIRNGAFEWLD